MSQENNIKREKDYLLNYLKIVDYKGNEYDFTSHFAEFTYEESIWNFPHGTLIAVDSIDYPTLLPIIGEERIKASFTRPHESKPDELLPELKFDLQVYSMSGKRQDSGSNKLQHYNLHYISDAVFASTNTRTFRAYKAKLYSDMVQEIYDSYLNNGKPIEIEKTLHEMDYVVNNQRPIPAINNIAKRSVSDEGNGSLYTIYEDRDKFYFMTVAKMFERPVTHEIRYEPKNLSEATPGLEHKPREKDRDIYNVDRISFGDNFDILASAQNGEGTSHLLSINPIRRKIVEKDLDLRRDWESFKHIETNKKWTDANKMFGDVKANPKMVISNIGNDTAPYISSHEPGIKPYFFEDYKLYRPSQLSQLKKHIMIITLSGDPRIKAGDMIQFNIPEFLGKTNRDEPEELDRYYQGKYLVAAVSHVIRQGTYVVNIELLKDTYNKELLNRDPLKEYEDKV